MNKVNESYMTDLIKLSTKCLENDILPVAAMAVDNETGEILAQAYKGKYMHIKTGHSEIIVVDAVLNHRKSLKNVTIYTTLEPCMMCAGYIMNVHGNIAYAMEDPYGGGCNQKMLENLPQRHVHNQISIERGLCRGDALVVFREFFANTEQKFWKNNKNNPLVALTL